MPIPDCPDRALVGRLVTVLLRQFAPRSLSLFGLPAFGAILGLVMAGWASFGRKTPD